MKKLILIPVICSIIGCTAQKPIVNTYNYTDNSTTVVGDNSSATNKASVTAEQTPDVKSETVRKDNMWLFYMVLTALGIGWYMSKKYKLL